MPFVVDIRLQGTKQAVPLAVLRPAVEPIEHRLPGAELLGQVSPRRAGSPPPEHSLDEVSVIPARLPDPVVLHEELLRDQAEAVGLPLIEVRIPSPCTNAIYEARMAEAL